jgi:hypothetical protein
MLLIESFRCPQDRTVAAPPHAEVVRTADPAERIRTTRFSRRYST